MTPLSQCDASAQERQPEQVIAEKKKERTLSWNVTHPT